MNETTDAATIFAPLWKHKWLILVVGILVAAGTYVYYKHRPSVYGAATQVYLGGGSEIQSLLNGSQGGNNPPSERSLADQAELINSNIVGEAVRRQLLAERDFVAADGVALAAPVSGNDFVAIATKASTGEGAARLANAYAKIYLRLRRARFRREVKAALASTRQQLRGVEANQGDAKTLQAQTLVERINQLQSELTIGNTGDQQINPAVASATPLSPKPKRNAIFGFALGIVLAAIAAYALSRFDRRLRTLAEVEAVFEAPLLTALPSIRRPIVHNNDKFAPAQSFREPLRRLHTTLELADLLRERDSQSSPRSLLFVSAEAGEGKSTLVASLGLVQSEAGERVAVIEADLRRPVQAGLLGLDGTHGLAEVLAGKLPVGEAIQRVESLRSVVDVDPQQVGDGRGSTTVLQPRDGGSVSVLVSGGTVANPPALLAGRSMTDLLRSVSDDFDYVLVDAPPPLEVSDVLPLLHMVDGIVIVARVGYARQASAERLRQLLIQSSGAPVLGVVATDVSSADIEAYGFSSAYYEQRPRRN